MCVGASVSCSKWKLSKTCVSLEFVTRRLQLRSPNMNTEFTHYILPVLGFHLEVPSMWPHLVVYALPKSAFLSSPLLFLPMQILLPVCECSFVSHLQLRLHIQSYTIISVMFLIPSNGRMEPFSIDLIMSFCVTKKHFTHSYIDHVPLPLVPDG